MKSYILLRNNKESGPYSFNDLKFFGIHSTDLIWIEGESTAWLHPGDVTELTVLAGEGQKRKIPERLEVAQPHTVSKGAALKSNLSLAENNRTEDVADHVSIYSTKKSRRRKTVSAGASLFGFTVLLIGGGFCAFVVKKMIDGFDDARFLATAEAKTIQAEVLTPSTTAHAARTNAPITLAPDYTQVAPLEESAPKKAAPSKVMFATSQREDKSTAISDLVKNDDDSNMGTSLIIDAKEKMLEKPKAEEQAPPKPAPSLQVSANDFSVGIFGGISNLELSVTNPSSRLIEKALVEVEFLKPNGSVVKSQTITIENISPGGSKKVAVPSSNRGVKIQYKVISVQADASVVPNDL